MEYGEILRISSFSVWMSENADQNSSEYAHFYAAAFSGLRQFLGTKIPLNMKYLFPFKNSFQSQYI